MLDWFSTQPFSVDADTEKKQTPSGKGNKEQEDDEKSITLTLFKGLYYRNF